MKNIKVILAVLLFSTISACKRAEFLEKKPSSDLLVPTTLKDFQAILENTNVMSFAGGLAQISSDDYVVDDANYDAVSTLTQRNAYTWEKDLYSGETAIKDWNVLYKQVFYSNAVLEGLDKSIQKDSEQGKFLRGWALFCRAFAFYDLVRNFCKVYQPITANSDLGIPLRLKSGIDYVQQRASLQESFDQIISDLTEAEKLLPRSRPATNLNRPSLPALYALLARIYLDMGSFALAESNADKALEIYSTLIDYNTISKSSSVPFTVNNEELLYNTSQVASYGEFTGSYVGTRARIAPDLIALYSSNDLRLNIFFAQQSDRTYTIKSGYVGLGSYPFTGLATDELYLIKSETQARKGLTNQALNTINTLMLKRWNPTATNPAKPFQQITANSSSEALDKILLERRKELVWRSLRWFDIKRLNLIGANIMLNRKVKGKSYSLAPNDPRYVFPIPDDEISQSGIKQNIR